MENGRTKKALRNVQVSIVSYTVVTILQFVNRSVFVHLLSAEYLGLNGLFTNVLSFLSLAELGVGDALTYSLYRPLKEDDRELIKSLMLFYKKSYIIIGCVILGAGGALTPFLSFFIKDMPTNMPLISVYYILYVINIGVSYFYTYKRTILICDQKQYISSITTSLKTILTALLQIIILYLTHNYLLYLVVMIICTVVENIIISKISDVQYPFLKTKDVKPLTKNKLYELKKNVSAMFCHKIGTVIVTSSDNLIISKYVGLSITGIYSNYTLVTKALNSLLSQVFTAMTASVGNLVANDDIEHDKYIMKNILFANFWIYSFCSVCLFCLFEPFIQIWVGRKYLLPIYAMASIVIVFYLTGIRKTVLVFRDVTGIFWYDRYKSIVESLVNIIFSVPLSIRYGVTGVMIGTIISTIGISFWIEARVLYKFHFQIKEWKYYGIQLIYFLITVISTSITYLMCTLVHFEGIGRLFCRAMICLLIPNIIIIILFYRTEEFKYFKNIGLNFIKQRMNS